MIPTVATLALGIEVYWPRVVFSATGTVVAVAAPIWTLRQWKNASPRICPPTWRAYLGLAAIGSATISGLSWLVMLPWAVITEAPGGDLAGFFWVGVIAGLIGFITSIFGN